MDPVQLSHIEHQQLAPRSVRCYLVTVSDTRTVETDTAGRAMADLLTAAGGTGISSRDSTYEAVSALLDKRLDGFGELFRMLSFEQIGAAAMMSRACAGLSTGRVVAALPG